jgi:Mg-chelatase subunit ChlD
VLACTSAIGAAIACSSTGGTDAANEGPGGSTGAGASGGTSAAGSSAAGGAAGGGDVGGAASGATSGAGGAAAGATSSFGGAVGMGGSLNLPDGGDADTGCATVTAQATRIPLTVYIMLDRSSSMSGTKWMAAITGLSTVLADPISDQITVGLSLFPKDGLLNNQCDFANYTDPLVPFAALPGNAAAVQTALMAADPDGYGTPIYPALGGALTRALTDKQASPAQNFAVLLVTDGAPAAPPATCGTVNPLDQPTIVALAAKALAQYQVKTFVVGLPGVDQTFADGLAMAGGTDSAIVVGNVDVEKDFETALAKVRGDGLGCTFPLPPMPAGKEYDFSHVNVTYTTGAGVADDLARSPGCAAGDAWDYDDATMPTAIVLCPAECQAVQADGLAKIDVVVGCATRLK